jgi:hypothetical protein
MTGDVQESELPEISERKRRKVPAPRGVTPAPAKAAVCLEYSAEQRSRLTTWPERRPRHIDACGTI